jgi:hypothetical protein
MSGDATMTPAGVVTIATIRDSLTVNTNLTVGGWVNIAGDVSATAIIAGDVSVTNLTASKPVFTDANKKLVSTGTLGVDQGGTAATTAPAARTNLGLVIGTHVQAYSANLDALALNNGTALTGVTVSAMSAANLIAGTVASAIDISAATNANASELKSGTIPNARIANLPASSLLAGSVASAIDLSAGTNMNAGELKSGSLDMARIAAGSVLPAVDASAATNLNASNLASGTVSGDRLAGVFNRVIVSSITTNCADGTNGTNVITFTCADYAGNEITDAATPALIGAAVRYWFSSSVLAAPTTSTNITGVATHNIKLLSGEGTNTIADAVFALKHQNADPITLTVTWDSKSYTDFNWESGGITRFIPLVRP